MSEEKIIEMLLKLNSSNDGQVYNTKLQSEVVNKVAKNITDIIYESFLQKSSESRIKRGNLLKFVTSVAETREPHLHVSVEGILELIKTNFQELDFNFQTLTDLYSLDKKVMEFYVNKNFKCNKKIQKLEFIKNYDQEKLISKYKLNIQIKNSACKINESNLRILLDHIYRIEEPVTDMWYRDQKIKLAYSLINLQTSNSEGLMTEILNTILCYEKLKESEKDFLSYLWMNEIGKVSPFREILQDQFYFILERIILKHATNILKLTDEFDVRQYLENNEEIRKMNYYYKQIDTYFRIKPLLYELYSFSFCNVNILKLCNAIFIRSS